MLPSSGGAGGVGQDQYRFGFALHSDRTDRFVAGATQSDEREGEKCEARHGTPVRVEVNETGRRRERTVGR